MNGAIRNLKAESGFNRITNTATHVIDSDVIVALEDTVINEILGANIRLNSVAVTGLTTVTLEKGDMLFGKFTSIDLTSGSVDCFNAC